MPHFQSISFDFDYLPLLVVMCLAWLIPMLLSLFRIKKIPSVIVEIFLGYFAGRLFLLNINPESLQILEFMALTGFIFLMFLSGLEIDMDQVIHSFPKKLKYDFLRKNPLILAVVTFSLTILLSYAGAKGLSSMVEIRNPWFFALIMGTTSVGIIMPVLKNNGETTGSYGQSMIISAAVADIFSIILFTFTAFILKSGFRIEIVSIFFLFFFLYLLYRLGNRFKNLPFLNKVSFQVSHAASQLSVRGTILLILIFIVISQYISSEVILLGAFLSGTLMSLFLHKGRSLLIVKLDGLGYGFFIPVFFIMVGVKFDPASLKEFEMTLIPFLLLLLLSLFAVKVIPNLILSGQYGIRRSLSAGFLLSSRLSLIIAASAIGLELGAISPGSNASFVIMAVVTCFLGPVLYNLTRHVSKLAKGTTIIVVGSSKGVLLARRLNVHGKHSVIVEKDRDRYENILSKGLNAYHADGLDPATFRDLILTSASYVVVDTGSKQPDISICEMLRKDLGHEKIITTANSSKIEYKLREYDVETIDIRRVLAATIEAMIVRPTTYHALIETFEYFSVEEITITNPDINGRRVKEISIHKDAILIMAKDGNNLFIPHGETYLRTGIALYVFGTDSALEDLKVKIK